MLWCPTIAEGLLRLDDTIRLVLLDVGLPDGSGLDACRSIRARSNASVVFLRARGDEIDRVLGREIGGADDIVKRTYLDVYTKIIEQYDGNYFDVIEQIAARVEKENSKNARLAKEAIEKKEKANFFAKKGGRLRLLAKRMREDAAQMEEEQVDVRREDKAIRPFTIPAQPNLIGEIVSLKDKFALSKNQHLLLTGPNGSGKTTLLESIVKGTAKGAKIADGIKVGYYRQDFSTLNFDDTVYDSLMAVMREQYEQKMRGTAASFLITSDVIMTKIGNLSEGQKGLVAFARLVLERPGLLILDEPTNHINFRHLPVIAKALDEYEGAPRAYRRETVRVVDDASVEQEEIAYVANKTGEFAPSRQYLAQIAQGARNHGLP